MSSYNIYWGYNVLAGIHTDIANARYEYWSSLAPLPVELVLSAGHKAKEHNGNILLINRVCTIGLEWIGLDNLY